MVAPEAALAVIRASGPELRSPHDRVAFALHASFMACGYSLAATGPRASSAEQELKEVGIQGWNELDGGYAFKYFTDDEKIAKVVTVRCTVINDMLMIDAAAAKDEVPPVHLEVKVTDYANESGAASYIQQYKNFESLMKLFNARILGKLAAKRDRDRGKSSADSEHRSSYKPPYTSIETGGYLPGMPGSGGGYMPGSAPISIGRSDLVPTVGAGVFEPKKDAAFESGEAGNIVGPHHPMWSRKGNDFHSEIESGPPMPAPIPPGARFEPFGPPGVPGFEPDRFGRGGRRDPQHFT